MKFNIGPKPHFSPPTLETELRWAVVGHSGDIFALVRHKSSAINYIAVNFGKTSYEKGAVKLWDMDNQEWGTP